MNHKGTTLGVYEITALIGEGGMGQVYQATDTTLGRQVAIKILPPALAADAEMVSRFEREARLLASLNHPHIAAIYGVEQSGDIRALVMELVDGEDLAQRLARGPVPIDEVWPIARQIAEALEAAHEQGVIHRDLKPGNIKVRPDGTVKVLDFGIAKALETPGAMSTQSVSALTVASPTPTVRGTILGTPAYMAPEQAKGKPVDRRADIWAFGAVLFEMLSGQRAFPGEDATDTIVAVVSKDPDWSLLPAHVPASIRFLLRRCLKKDRKLRLDSAAAVRLEIDDALSAPAAEREQASASPGRVRALVAAIVTLAVVLIAMLITWAPWRPAADLPELRLDVSTAATDDPTSFALAPDGKQVVFVAAADGVSRLWLRSFSAQTAQPLSGTEGATAPFWSPDGRSIGFFATGALKRLDLGAAPQTLAPAVTGAGGMWTSDETIVFAPNLNSQLMRVPAIGGATTPVTTLGPQQTGHRWPQMMADGRRFLFFSTGSPEVAGIYLATLEGDAPIRVTFADSGGLPLPNGWLLWVRTGELLAQRLDPTQGRLTGEPVTVAAGVSAESSLSRSPVSVTANGLVAYRTGPGRQRQLIWVNRLGTSLGTFGSPDASSLSQPRVSPDGRRVVVTRTVEGNTDLWLLDGTRTSRFTFDAARDASPVWSPDGSRIVFHSIRSGRYDLYNKAASGGEAEELLVASDQPKAPTGWSADGRFLFYLSSDPKTGADVWVVPLFGNRIPYVFLQTPFREAYAVSSPNNQWIAYQSNESGRMEVYVRPFAAPDSSTDRRPAGKWQMSTAGGVFPVWSLDGRELYYLNPAGAMMAVPIMTTTNFAIEPGVPKLLFSSLVVGGGIDAQQGRQYDVAPDGRFLINTTMDNAIGPITLLMNWHPEPTR